MVLDAELLNTKYYKVRIKSKKEQSSEWSCAPGVVAIKKGAFGSHSTKIANFTLLITSWMIKKMPSLQNADPTKL